MQPIEHATNAELLSKLAGKPAADALVQHYGGLIDLSKASFDELRHVKGIGQSKAAAIKSAFLLGQGVIFGDALRLHDVESPARPGQLA